METKYRNVLLIDDTEIDLYITRVMMETSGFAENIHTRSSAIEALAWLKVNADNPTNLPEIIFLDIRMPVMDGFSFLEEFQKLPSEITMFCKIYLLSSTLDTEDIQKAERNKFVQAFVSKPLTPAALNTIKLSSAA